MATKVTIVDGSTRTGVYAKDGSINVVIRDGLTRTGIYHPCGAFNIVVVADLSKGLYHPSGAYNAVLLFSGQYRFGMWSGTALGTGGNPAAWASSPAPGGCRWDFVTFNGALVTRSGEPVVSLVRIN